MQKAENILEKTVSPGNENWGSSERLVILQKCPPLPWARAVYVRPVWKVGGGSSEDGVGLESCSRARVFCAVLGEGEAFGST